MKNFEVSANKSTNGPATDKESKQPNKNSKSIYNYNNKNKIGKNGKNAEARAIV